MSRPLAARDLDSVVAIDAELSGRPRRDYFARRLAAAQRDPERHLQSAIDEGGTLAGFMLGRTLEGEFGRTEKALRLEAFGVSRRAQHHGLGRALGESFEGEAHRRSIAEIRTTALWREHDLLRYLDRAGYALATDHVLDCALASYEEDPLESEAPGDFERLPRDTADIAILEESDIEGVARIDRRHTGRDRRGYLCRTLREALADSAVRVSLAARVDGQVAGFLMARTDYGDYGRAEPVAVIDALGVDPLRAHHGIGRALLSQLFANLRALGVERAETVIAAGNVGLLGFFDGAGFVPAERLAFVKRL